MSNGQNGSGHERCGARTRSGERCGLPAGWGLPTGVCRLHGGCTPNHVARARHLAAERAVATYGLPIQTSPEQALIDELHRTAGHVAWLGGRVAGLDPAELASADGISVWLQLYRSERRHLADVAKAAIVSAASTVLADSARHLGQRMADVLDRALTGTTGLGWEQRDEVLARFAAELGAAGTGPDG